MSSGGVSLLGAQLQAIFTQTLGAEQRAGLGVGDEWDPVPVLESSQSDEGGGLKNKMSSSRTDRGTHRVLWCNPDWGSQGGLPGEGGVWSEKWRPGSQEKAECGKSRHSSQTEPCARAWGPDRRGGTRFATVRQGSSKARGHVQKVTQGPWGCLPPHLIYSHVFYFY